MMDRETLLSTLSKKKPEYKSKYGIEDLYLFGSYATGDPDKESDIDLAVNIPSQHKNYKNFINLKKDLQQDLDGKEIDLVYYNAINLNPLIKIAIDTSKIEIE